MRINRKILKENGLSNKDATTILKRAAAFQITFDVMSKDKIGRIFPLVHFNKDEWIAKQEERIANLRFDYLPSNARLLKIVRSLKC